MTVSNDDPNTFLPGTWEKIKDRFLLGSGDSYTNASTGGSSTINIRHRHTLDGTAVALVGRSTTLQSTISYKTGGSISGINYDRRLSNAPGIAGVNEPITDTSALHGYTSYDGSNTQSIMPPYLVVNIWKRIS